MTHRHKALIVDDQQGIMEILGAILSSLDHDYDYARTQREVDSHGEDVCRRSLRRHSQAETWPRDDWHRELL